jgi:hypothetical protein
VSQRTIAGGDVVETWKSGDASVVAVGAAGSTIAIHPVSAANGSGSVTASVTSAPIDKSGPDAAARAVAAYAASGRSVYADALAVSGDPAWAARVAAQAGTTSTATANRPATSATPHGIIDSACANAVGDSNHAYGRVCVVQNLITATSNGTWYIGDQTSGSANDTATLHALTRFHAWDSYPTGNGIVEWNPQSTIPKGSCSNVTASLSYSGVGVSQSSTVCPDKLTPTIYDHGFGTEWSGCDHHAYVEGAPGVDVDKRGPTASAVVTAWSYIHWDLSC